MSQDEPSDELLMKRASDIAIHEIGHALGLDHEKLTFSFQGLDHRLTGVEKSRVVQEIFA